MVSTIAKPVLNIFGMDYDKILENISRWSMLRAMRDQGLEAMAGRLTSIVPDISQQEERGKERVTEFWNIKRRSLQAFQCALMLKALERMKKKDITVVDIGDSAGTHMLYLKTLADGRFNIDTVSVNLDPRAIKKIEARGLKAMLCRAEELDLGNKPVDLFTSFEMVEHLHNPAIFFKRLAKRQGGEQLLITVPFVRQSRVGLFHARAGSQFDIYAEDEHIFELSPRDWELLMLHSGWRIDYSSVYYQYPKGIPVVSSFFRKHWRRSDYEGFWGAILTKDTSLCDHYKDWEK